MVLQSSVHSTITILLFMHIDFVLIVSSIVQTNNILDFHYEIVLVKEKKDVIYKKYRGSKLVDVGSKLWGQSKIHDLRLGSLLALQHPI